MQTTHTSYDILEIRASGGHGVVAIARSPDGDEVAIKVLQLDKAVQEAVLKRARDEARMLSRLDHPNLVRVAPVVSVNGRPAVVMEYVRGASLEHVLREHGPLPPSEALAVIRDACRGLDAAWNTPSGSDPRPMQVVHRDLKPGNLMLSVDGVLKVVDFGLAKARFEDRESQSMAFVPGSRGYMAPERFDAVDTPKGDVYALGLSLFELLAGTRPVISLRYDRHDLDVERQVGALAVDGLDPVAEPLRALLRDMCCYEPDERPWPPQVAARIEALLGSLPAPDLPGLAARTVVPLHEARPAGDPRLHPQWADVRFLTGDPLRNGAPVDVNAQIREAVSSPDFPGRSRELAALLAAHPEGDVTPLLNLLHHAAVPSWQFWRRAPAPERTVAALEALGPVRDRVQREVERLARHRDPDVRTAALALLGQA